MYLFFPHMRHEHDLFSPGIKISSLSFCGNSRFVVFKYTTDASRIIFILATVINHYRSCKYKRLNKKYILLFKKNCLYAKLQIHKTFAHKITSTISGQIFFYKTWSWLNHFRVSVIKWVTENPVPVLKWTHTGLTGHTMLHWPLLRLYSIHLCLIGKTVSLWYTIYCDMYKAFFGNLAQISLNIYHCHFFSHSLFTTLGFRLRWSETVLAGLELHQQSPCWDSCLLSD